MKQDVVNAIIEIPFRSRNKYEVDHDTGRLKLDRVLYSAMGYPAEYGFLEDTLALDGDPLDILVIGTEPTSPGCIVPARVIGYLEAVDNGFEDYKLISVVDVDPRYDNVRTLDDLTPFILEEIKNFFENYKTLQKIEVKVGSYHDKEEALELIKTCKKRYQDQKGA
ncbi:MAG: inorganic diphosphatase [Bacilli bacterium]|jgi:inorganic diphosphatase|nr:inorganic diphosphatase [Bacilli bacterium]